MIRAKWPMYKKSVWHLYEVTTETFGYRAAGQAGVVADENKGEGGIRTATYLFSVR